MNPVEITLNDLSGAYTLPLFHELLARTKDISVLCELKLLFAFLIDNGQGELAYQLICLCYRLVNMNMPDLFFTMTKDSKARENFAGEFLVDFGEILEEFQ